MTEPAPVGIDVTVPSSARVYDYLLGGKSNYAVDRKVAEVLLGVAPETPRVARANRAFLVQAVRLAAEEGGVRQFIDVGTGIPTSPSVHETAQAIDPSARVVYVDHDPIVQAHNDILLARYDSVIAIREDVRQPETILGHPDVQALIDFDEPICVLLVGVLHFVSDEHDPAGIVAGFRDRMAPGSYIVQAHSVAESDPEVIAQLSAATAGTSAETTWRSIDQVRTLFDGFDLLDPGLVRVQQWRPHIEMPLTRLRVEGGVGRKA